MFTQRKQMAYELQNLNKLTNDEKRNAEFVLEQIKHARWIRTTLLEDYCQNYISMIDKDSSVGDVNVDDYLTTKKLNPINTDKTPDLCFMVSDNLYLGDIAVTNDIRNVTIIKKTKYDPLRDKIRALNPNIRVTQLDVVLNQKGTNLLEQVGQLSTLARFVVDPNDLMNELNNLAIYEQRAFAVMKNNKFFKDIYDAEHKRSVQENESLLFSDLTYADYTPRLTEDQIANMIFNQMDNERDHLTQTTNFTLDKVMTDLRFQNDNQFEHADSYSVPLPLIMNLESVEDNFDDLELLKSYLDDLILYSMESAELCSLLPTHDTLEKMQSMKFDMRSHDYEKNAKDINLKTFNKLKYGRVTPYWASEKELNKHTQETKNYYMKYSQQNIKKNFNKGKPKTIPSSDWQNCIDMTDNLIKYYSQNDSPHESANLQFDYAEDFREASSIDKIKPIYEMINRSYGIVMSSVYRKYVNDLAYLNRDLKKGIYYSIPVQSNTIIMSLTNNNTGGSNPHMGFCSLTRFPKNRYQYVDMIEKANTIFFGMVENIVEGTDYYYILSKLQKYDLDKMSKLSTIDSELRTHCIIMLDYASKSLTEEQYAAYCKNYIGIMSILALDLHQKPSMMLDLMKYLVSMPFSELSAVEELLIDKLNIQLKTILDPWLVHKILHFFNINLQNSKTNKPKKMIVTSKGLSVDSLTVIGNYNLFCNLNITTNSLQMFLTESQLLFQIRRKKLYNSQFIDKACQKVLDNNDTMRYESLPENCGSWVTEGYHDLKPFPFNSEFAYCRDAMFYAQKLEEENDQRNYSTVHNKIRGKLKEISLYNLSMRGACREAEEITEKGKSITALNAGLRFLRKEIQNNDTENTMCYKVMSNNMNRKMLYNMSEKEQRGDGRPIGSGSFTTKQKLYCLETTYKIIDQFQEENLLVKGVNRSAKISSTAVDVMQYAFNNKLSVVGHIVMDQSQFSEGDNMHKFIANIKDNSYIPDDLRRPLMEVAYQMMDRTQYFPRIPLSIKEKQKNDYLVGEGGVKGIAGWVQGMLNISSTHIHIIAVKWLSMIFNKYVNSYYKTNYKPIYIKHLVNSDDSYACIACESEEILSLFHSFLFWGKKLFVLRENKKKSYVSKFIGEIIQKYVANGSVVNVYAKSAIAVYNNNQGCDPVKDITASIGALGTLYKEGAPETVCTYIRAELKNQIYRLYSFGHKKYNNLAKLNVDQGLLPVELCGWPIYISTFELVTSGFMAQSLYVLKNTIKDKTSAEFQILVSSVYLNLVKRKYAENWTFDYTDDDPKVLKDIKAVLLSLDSDTLEINNDNDEELDYSFVSQSGNSYINDNIFTRNMISPFNFIIPFPKKVSLTLKELSLHNYEGTNLSGLIKTRQSVQKAVADIKQNINDLIISLSESGFTKDIRSRAMANSLMARTRCVQVGGMKRKLTIIKSFKALIQIYSMINTTNITKCVDVLNQVLEDSSCRARISEDVKYKTITKSKQQVGPYIANKVPVSFDSVDIANDLQIVLALILDHDIIEKEKLVLKYPDKIEHDIRMIKDSYSKWLSDDKPTLQTLRAIYYHYLNNKVRRWHIAPHLDTSTLRTYIRDCYLTCFDGKYRYTGVVSQSQFSNSMVNVDKLDSDMSGLMAAWEVLLYVAQIPVLEDIDPYKYYSSKIKLKLKNGRIQSLDQLVLGGLYNIIFNRAPNFTKKILATMRYLITGDDELMDQVAKENTISITWIIRQKVLTTLTGEVQYIGPFSALVSKGKNAVLIEGEPGNIKNITSNTKDCNIIDMLLCYFTMKNTFTGPFTKVKDRQRWVNNVWNYKGKLYPTMIKLQNNGMTSIVTCDPNNARSIPGLIPFTFDIRLQSANTLPPYRYKYEVDLNRKLVVAKINTWTVDIADQDREFILFSFRSRLLNVDYNYLTIDDIIIDSMNINELNKAGILKEIVRNEYNRIPMSKLEYVIEQLFADNDIIQDTIIEMINKMILRRDVDLEEKVEEVNIPVGAMDIDDMIDAFQLDLEDETEIGVDFDLGGLNLKSKILQSVKLAQQNVSNLSMISVCAHSEKFIAMKDMIIEKLSDFAGEDILTMDAAYRDEIIDDFIDLFKSEYLDTDMKDNELITAFLEDSGLYQTLKTLSSEILNEYAQKASPIRIKYTKSMTQFLFHASELIKKVTDKYGNTQSSLWE
ncbi:MAG: RdRp [hymenopteran phasma-related virus OKIAV252]|uniref:RdRp n=1 Tax=hymenopteran phasma-related virus OKIAV252 TaxID=2847802 RepID=UPI00248441BD|nr:MAG: RdRp [hymenopteran phasma-related virus OKIAV252]WBM84628.1 MAG: RdRp [hymenopteran phasma-related virus OKIAV252]